MFTVPFLTRIRRHEQTKIEVARAGIKLRQKVVTEQKATDSEANVVARWNAFRREEDSKKVEQSGHLSPARKNSDSIRRLTTDPDDSSVLSALTADTKRN